MSNQILSPGHPLYSNIIRGLSFDNSGPRLMDSIPGGTDHLAYQTTPQLYTEQITAAVTPIQGIGVDASYFYEINTTSIAKYSRSGGAAILTNATPFVGLPTSDHIGSGFVANGYLVVPTVKWTAASQTSTNQRISFYDTNTLSLQSTINISGTSACNASGVCIGHTGNYFVTSYFSGAGADARKTDVYEFNSAGTQVAKWVLSSAIIGIQGIAYDTAKQLYVITSFDNTTPSQYTIIVVDTAFNVLYRMNPTGMGSVEQEGISYYDGLFYTHENNTGIRTFTLDGLYMGTSGSTQQVFITSANVPTTGTIIIRGIPRTLFDFNTLWDNNVTANDWESWINAAGAISGRINASFSAASASTLVAANSRAVFGFHWTKSGATVDYQVSLNGSVVATQTGRAWVAAPDLYLGGKNASNTDCNFTYMDVLVFNTNLSGTDISDLYTNFDYLYTAPVGQPAIKRVSGVPGAAINRGVW